MYNSYSPAANAQHEPHLPWSLTGDIAPVNLQSIFLIFCCNRLFWPISSSWKGGGRSTANDVFVNFLIFFRCLTLIPFRYKFSNSSSEILSIYYNNELINNIANLGIIFGPILIHFKGLLVRSEYALMPFFHLDRSSWLCLSTS